MNPPSKIARITKNNPSQCQKFVKKNSHRYFTISISHLIRGYCESILGHDGKRNESNSRFLYPCNPRKDYDTV